MFVYLRFNRWNDVLNMPPPVSDVNEPIRIAMWHFMRGMALAGTAQLGAASVELASVGRARKTLGIAARPGWYNSSEAILGIASDMLAAKIARVQGKRAQEISYLRSALAIQDKMLYIEPPDWYAPVREPLGAAVFGGGDYGAATQIFREDLRRNPRNPRSLFGLYQCAKAKGREAEALAALRELNAAWKNADTPLTMRAL